MVHWQILAGDAASAPSVELTKATTRKASWKLADTSSLSFTIDGRHPQAGEINELVTDVHLLRDGVALYTGRVGATKDTLDEATHKVDVSTSDTRALLDRRLWHQDDKDYADVEQSTIVADLITEAQAYTGGDLGIGTDNLAATGVTATVSIAAGSSILAALNALSTAGDPTSGGVGFDWGITPGWTGRQAQLWCPQRGADNGVILDHIYTGRPRTGILASIERDIDPGSFANAFRASGGVKEVTVSQVITVVNSDGSQSTQTITSTIDYPTTPVWSEDDTIGLAGRWEASGAYTDIVDQDALAAKAAAMLATMDILTPTYSITLRTGAWDGPDHIWLGDTVRLIVKSGRLDVDTSLRVTGLDLTLGDDGQEDVTLTVGTAPSTVLGRLYRMERRLAALERG